ncbi:hypothetical protein U9M48_037221, partial [Paspalum notatum var. saurae]
STSRSIHSSLYLFFSPGALSSSLLSPRAAAPLRGQAGGGGPPCAAGPRRRPGSPPSSRAARRPGHGGTSARGTATQRGTTPNPTRGGACGCLARPARGGGWPTVAARLSSELTSGASTRARRNQRARHGDPARHHPRPHARRGGGVLEDGDGRARARAPPFLLPGRSSSGNGRNSGVGSSCSGGGRLPRQHASVGRRAVRPSASADAAACGAAGLERERERGGGGAQAFGGGAAAASRGRPKCSAAAATSAAAAAAAAAAADFTARTVDGFSSYCCKV